MKVCQNCGHENSDKGKFCEECGEKLVEAPKFCPECGTKLEGTPKFCPECGSNLAEDTEVSDDDEHEDDSLDSDDDEESSENPFGGLVKAFKAFSALNDDDNESDDYDEEYAEDDEDSADYEEYVDEDEHEDDETIIDENLRELIDNAINTITNEINEIPDENFRELIDEAKTDENLRELIDDEMTKEKFCELMKEKVQRKLIAEKKIEKKIREIVDKYINVIASGNMWYRSAAVAKPEHAQVFQNVRANIAKDVSQSEILGFIDTTVIGKGKAGLVFTTEALYEKSAGSLWKVPYSRMSFMNYNGKKIVFGNTEGCGISLLVRGMDIYIDSDSYNIPALKDCLEEITAII